MALIDQLMLLHSILSKTKPFPPLVPSCQLLQLPPLKIGKILVVYPVSVVENRRITPHDIPSHRSPIFAQVSRIPSCATRAGINLRVAQ